MRIAILDDNQLDIDYFKARAESFLKKKGDRTYQISEYTSGVPLVDMSLIHISPASCKCLQSFLPYSQEASLLC